MSNVLALVLTVLGVAMVVAPIVYYTACRIADYRLKTVCKFVGAVMEEYKKMKDKTKSDGGTNND